jgi:hypothetical protein
MANEEGEAIAIAIQVDETTLVDTITEVCTYIMHSMYSRYSMHHLAQEDKVESHHSSRRCHLDRPNHSDRHHFLVELSLIYTPSVRFYKRPQ